MINKYPYDIETPLDRRAMTIDILAGEVARKNKSISYWRKKAETFLDKCEEFSKDLKKVRVQRNTYQAKMKKLEHDNWNQKEILEDTKLTWNEQVQRIRKEAREELKERSSRKKLNGKAKVIKIMKTQRTIRGKHNEEI